MDVLIVSTHGGGWELVLDDRVVLLWSTSRKKLEAVREVLVKRDLTTLTA